MSRTGHFTGQGATSFTRLWLRQLSAQPDLTRDRRGIWNCATFTPQSGLAVLLQLWKKLKDRIAPSPCEAFTGLAAFRFAPLPT